MLSGMAGATLGIWVAHGEGNVKFLKDGALKAALADNLAPVRYVDDDNVPTTTYPFNPNGSPEGIAALTSPDGKCGFGCSAPSSDIIHSSAVKVPSGHHTCTLPLVAHLYRLWLADVARVCRACFVSCPFRPAPGDDAAPRAMCAAVAVAVDACHLEGKGVGGRALDEDVLQRQGLVRLECLAVLSMSERGHEMPEAGC